MRGAVRGSQRFFLLQESTLTWFKSPRSTHCQGALDLTRAVILPPRADAPYPLWSFRIETPLSLGESLVSELQELEALATRQLEADDLGAAQATIAQAQRCAAEAERDGPGGGTTAPIVFEFECGKPRRLVSSAQRWTKAELLGPQARCWSARHGCSPSRRPSRRARRCRPT